MAVEIIAMRDKLNNLLLAEASIASQIENLEFVLTYHLGDTTTTEV
jgi:hypothetical protein